MDVPIIETRRLAYAYTEAGENKDVLTNVNLSIATGETVALVGASGSGKSTLLNLLGGIDRPSQGDILLNGRSITTMKEPELTLFRRDHVGFIYQLFNLIPTLTIAENTALPLELASMPLKQRKAQTEYWLEKVGLQDRKHAFPDQLSGGEQQRVAVARALVSEPAIVWADEPTGNLDSETAASVVDLLLEINAGGQTLVIVTHDRGLGSLGHRLVQIRDGLVTYDGVPSGLLETSP